MRYVLFALLILSAPARAESGQASVDYGHVTPFDAPGFHGLVATGEKFDAKRIAVAHRWLPLRSMVMVIYRRRWMLAEVVDRGPCLSDVCQRSAPKRVRERILDLTPSLASKLRFPGLGRVTVVSLRMQEAAP